MSYFYVGSPYSRYPGGIEAAYREICRVMTHFARAGIPAFSPIAHCYPIAMAGGIDPLDHRIWPPFCEPVMTGAKGLVVVKMATWEDSYGLRQEIRCFESARKPIRYLDPELLLLDGEALRVDAPRIAA
jgi:hypothetical protein